jgi:hypothetical protein
MEFPKSFFSPSINLLKVNVTLAKYVENVGEYASNMKTKGMSTEFLSTNYKRTENCGALPLDGGKFYNAN